MDTNNGSFDFCYYHSAALHEAGHAVLSVVLRRKLLSVSIERDAWGDGSSNHTPDISTRQAIVEEIAIMLAGGEAASQWGFVTNVDCDEKRALKALARCLAVSDPEESREHIRACVRASIEGLRVPIGLFALALFNRKKIEGTEATTFIENSICKPVELKGCLSRLVF